MTTEAIATTTQAIQAISNARTKGSIAAITRSHHGRVIRHPANQKTFMRAAAVILIADRRDQKERLNRFVHTLPPDHSTHAHPRNFHGHGKRSIVAADEK